MREPAVDRAHDLQPIAGRKGALQGKMAQPSAMLLARDRETGAGQRDFIRSVSSCAGLYDRLGLEHVLQKHRGSVNCVAFNENGEGKEGLDGV